MDALNIVTNITSGLTFYLQGLAVSLVVGGIGIMNIMLYLLVRERRDRS